MTRLLLITSPHVAIAVWLKSPDGWECVEATPIVAWMVGMTAADAKAAIEADGWAYTWLNQVDLESQ